MVITDRDIDLLVALVRYYVLSRPQIHRLLFQSDKNGRNTRRRLQTLVEEHLIGRQKMLYCSPSVGSPASVYYPVRKGCELLRDHFDDDRYLLTPNQPPIPHHINHWLDISETHLALDQAVAAQNDVSLVDWISEWDIVNKDETEPEKRFRLFTKISDAPRLVCSPDAAFVLCARGHRKIFYLEQDRATNSVEQVIRSKMNGYAMFANHGLHREHFPTGNAPTFDVLLIAPSPKRRDSLRRAMIGKPGAKLWRFASMTEATPEKILFEPVFYPCEGDAVPLVKRQMLLSGTCSQSGPGEGRHLQ